MCACVGCLVSYAEVWPRRALDLPLRACMAGAEIMERGAWPSGQLGCSGSGHERWHAGPHASVVTKAEFVLTKENDRLFVRPAVYARRGKACCVLLVFPPSFYVRAREREGSGEEES
ncbi:hypothetical protein VPH35_107633 [Triticum aestivum]